VKGRAVARRRLSAVLVGAAASAGAGLLRAPQAQPRYPSRPVRFIVPFPAGGSTDVGARVIGVVGSEAKAEIARRHGCWKVLISGRDELVESVKTLTRGAGVNVVYDAVGKDTFIESLDCLRRLGMMVTFGNASGPPPAISPLELSKRGSLFLTRPTLFNYIATRKELTAAARELFAVVRARKVRVVIGQKYPLAHAAAAAFGLAMVVLVAAMQHGATAMRVAKLSQMFGVSRRTVARWRTWWLSVFAKSPFWHWARALLMPPVDEKSLPASLLERFAGSLEERLIALLRFLAPFTGGAGVHAP